MNKLIPVHQIAFPILIVLFLVSACGGQASTPIMGQEQVQTKPAETTPSPIEEISLTDASGRVVILENPPSVLHWPGNPWLSSGMPFTCFQRQLNAWWCWAKPARTRRSLKA